MKIKVCTYGWNRLEEEVGVYSLSYDCKANSFVMEAGGYQIAPDQQYRPIRLHVQWDLLFVDFENREDAVKFIAWLKRADRMALESFERMLD